MASSIKVSVEPRMLGWGRETAGYGLEDAARKIGIAFHKLIAAEAGEVELTYLQLSKMAKVYKHPLAVFFLDEPPPPSKLTPDFRLSPDFLNRPHSPRLNVEIRRARERRDEALQLAEELNEHVPVFRHRAKLGENAEEVGARVRRLFNVSVETQFSWADNREALKAWKRAVESQRVLVFENSRIAMEEMRGLSIFCETLPIIVLNGGDSYAGRVFTLLHEFSHLLLRQEGLCDLALIDSATSVAHTEVFCNAVAASVLVPANVLRTKLPVGGPRDWNMDEISELSKMFKVSKEVALRRLLTLNMTSERHYNRMRNVFIREYQEARQNKRKSKGGPDPAVMAVRNLGRPFIGLVLDAYASEKISLSAVSSYLGIKLKHLGHVEDLIRRNVVAK